MRSLLIVALGVLLTLAGNIISFTYHTYQQELMGPRTLGKSLESISH